MGANITIPSLESDRLLFRPLNEADVHDVFALFSNPNVMKYDGGVTVTQLEQAEEYIFTIGHSDFYKRKEGVTWAFIEKKTGNFVGTGGIKNWYGRPYAEIGLVLSEPYWNQRFGFEAMNTMIQFGFQTLQLNFIYAAILLENKPALRLVERLGFRFHHVEQQYWLSDYPVQALIFTKENTKV